MDYKIFPGPVSSRADGTLYESYAIHLAPASAGWPVAEGLCALGWEVDELHVNYPAGQATVHLRAPDDPGNPKRLEGDLRHVWTWHVLQEA